MRDSAHGGRPAQSVRTSGPAAFRELDTVPYDGPSDYEKERRPVVMLVLLAIVTLGLYPAIWVIRRQPFLDRLDVGKRLGMALPTFLLVANVSGFFLALMGKDTASIRPIFSLAAMITALIANFRVLGILRSDSARTGRFLEFSTIGTFFFGVLYLQFKMNQMADVPARVERPRRKKKKKARVAPAAEALPEAGDELQAERASETAERSL